jgi:DNA-binding protein HU-beta
VRELQWLSESTSQNWCTGWRGGWTETVAEIVDGFLEEIYAALKGGDSVSLRGFGSFYVRAERDSWVFKFNPSQRLRALFGWSSTYRGPL